MTFVSMIPANGYYACYDTSREHPAVEVKPLVCWALKSVWAAWAGTREAYDAAIEGYVVDGDEPALTRAADCGPPFLGYVYAANSVIAVRKGYEMLTGEPAPAADALARAQNQTFFTAPEE